MVDDPGSGYASAPSVSFTDTGTGTGAAATAVTDVGVIDSLTLQTGGTGYVTGTGIKKFQDSCRG